MLEYEVPLFSVITKYKLLKSPIAEGVVATVFGLMVSLKVPTLDPADTVAQVIVLEQVESAQSA